MRPICSVSSTAMRASVTRMALVKTQSPKRVARSITLSGVPPHPQQLVRLPPPRPTPPQPLSNVSQNLYYGAMLGLVTGSAGAAAYGMLVVPHIIDACMV